MAENIRKAKYNLKPKHIVSILVAIIAAFEAGATISVNSTMSDISTDVNTQLVQVAGDNNEITINQPSDIVDEIVSLQQEKKQLLELNEQYKNELSEKEDEIISLSAQLSTQTNDTAQYTFYDMSLSVDGEDVVVNSKNAMVDIEGREYLSKEIAEALLEDSQSVTYRDGTMYVGTVVEDDADLFDQWVVESSGVEFEENVNDSYGGFHTNVLFFYGKSTITFNLNRKYTKLKLSIAMDEGAHSGYTGYMTIKADGNIVYSSTELFNTTEPYTVTDISLGNCSLLTVEYSRDGGLHANDCIIYDVIVYN